MMTKTSTAPNVFHWPVATVCSQARRRELRFPVWLRPRIGEWCSRWHGFSRRHQDHCREPFWRSSHHLRPQCSRSTVTTMVKRHRVRPLPATRMAAQCLPQPPPEAGARWAVNIRNQCLRVSIPQSVALSHGPLTVPPFCGLTHVVSLGNAIVGPGRAR
jgi:hypothetical protein